MTISLIVWLCYLLFVFAINDNARHDYKFSSHLLLQEKNQWFWENFLLVARKEHLCQFLNFLRYQKRRIQSVNLLDRDLFMIDQYIIYDIDELINNLLGRLVKDDFHIKLCKCWYELLNLFSTHLVYFLMKLQSCFNLGCLCFFTEKRDDSVDVLIMVLNYLCVF